ncbi:MAG: GNAT family N-acetyltransferase [Planctomycetes bacterium]|nr:GNAT family N-acetyltransferase [Planctomycetota bacterium]
MLIDAYPKTVVLKDGTEIVIRSLARGDFEQLLDFFTALPEEDRVFLRDDVRDPELIHRWTEQLDLARVIPLVAYDDSELVGSASLHIMPHECMRHVGHVRLVTARSHRHKGLGALMTRELVALAEERALEKVQAHVIEDNLGAVRMFEKLGFKTVAVLEGMVKDRSWKTRNLAIMVNDVANLTQIMEQWIQESMLPSHRVPGDGA